MFFASLPLRPITFSDGTNQEFFDTLQPCQKYCATMSSPIDPNYQAALDNIRNLRKKLVAIDIASTLQFEHDNPEWMKFWFDK